MTDNRDSEIRGLKKEGVSCNSVTQENWSRSARLKLPGGGSLGLYEPRHARPLFRLRYPKFEFAYTASASTLRTNLQRRVEVTRDRRGSRNTATKTYCRTGASIEDGPQKMGDAGCLFDEIG